LELENLVSWHFLQLLIRALKIVDSIIPMALHTDTTSVIATLNVGRNDSLFYNDRVSRPAQWKTINGIQELIKKTLHLGSYETQSETASRGILESIWAIIRASGAEI
jgi:hypothetical protein